MGLARSKYYLSEFQSSSGWWEFNYICLIIYVSWLKVEMTDILLKFIVFLRYIRNQKVLVNPNRGQFFLTHTKKKKKNARALELSQNFANYLLYTLLFDNTIFVEVYITKLTFKFVQLAAVFWKFKSGLDWILYFCYRSSLKFKRFLFSIGRFLKEARIIILTASTEQQ